MSSRNQYVLDFNSIIILDRNFFKGRSPTIVAAYLVYTLKITPDEAVGMILKKRPFVQYVVFRVVPNSTIEFPQRPNSNFSRQMDLFHNSQGKISRTDKDIRRFYLERTVHEVISAYSISTFRTTLKISSQTGMARV